VQEEARIGEAIADSPEEPPGGRTSGVKGRDKTMVAKKTGKPIQKGKKLKTGTLARKIVHLRALHMKRGILQRVAPFARVVR
jgi:hypothetical protein